MRRISPAECQARLDSVNPPVLLDVREDSALAIAGLPAAIHIPMDQVPDRINELNLRHSVVVMCRSGARSRQVVCYLVQNGFPEVANLEGGILAWSEELDPSIPTY